MKPHKIAIVIGHSRSSRGAINYLGEHEYDFNTRIASGIKSSIETNEKDIACHILSYDAPESIRTQIERIKPFFTLELHFNSFQDVATGCECLMLSDSKNFDATMAAADMLITSVSEIFKIRKRNNIINENVIARGIKLVSKGTRGHTNLSEIQKGGSAISLLIEPVFGNFKTNESVNFFSNENRYIQLISWFIICDVFGFITNKIPL